MEAYLLAWLALPFMKDDNGGKVCKVSA